MKSYKKILTLIVTVSILSLISGLTVVGWTNPTDVPPYGNVPPPVNLGNSSQTKEGEFISNSQITAGGFFTAGNIEGASLDVTDLHVSSVGGVGVGVTTTDQQLEVKDEIRITSDHNPRMDFNSSNYGKTWGLIVEGQNDNFKIVSTDDGTIWKHDVQISSTGTVEVLNGNIQANNFGTDDTNVGVGYQSLYSNTGDFNVAVGSETLYSNTSGSHNTALGWNSLNSNTTGDANTAIGNGALAENATGTYNVAVGVASLWGNISGSNNIAIGYQALNSDTDGFNNIVLGSQALKNGGGYRNIAIGFNVLNQNGSGFENIAIGEDVLQNGMDARSNVGVGVSALDEASGVDSSRNTAVGGHALGGMSLGSGNVALGGGAGNGLTNIEESIYIGFRAALTERSDSVTNEIVIGSRTDPKGSNTVVLGNSNITNTYLKGALNLTPRGEPADPVSNHAVMWLSDGSVHDQGDLVIKINVGGDIRSTIIADFSEERT